MDAATMAALASGPCPDCKDTGWVPLPPDPARPQMVWRRPCTCAAGREGAHHVARFVQENEPDRIIPPDEEATA